MIVIQTQLSSDHFWTVCAAISERFPGIVGQVQAINAAGQFRLVPVRGATMPDGLTADAVQTMIANLQANVPYTHTGALWAGPMNRRYARRMR
jgi:hypothetical protein